MDQERRSFITVSLGGVGYFAVMVWWNPELGGFWEPYQTGVGRYRTPEKAIIEGKTWAKDEGLEFKEPSSKEETNQQKQVGEKKE